MPQRTDYYRGFLKHWKGQTQKHQGKSEFKLIKKSAILIFYLF